MNTGLSARVFAHQTLMTWFRGNDYLDHILNFENSGLDDRDRRFAESLIHLVIQHQRLYDYILKVYCKKPPALHIRILLYMGSCEILHMQVPDHAAVFSAVALSKVLAPHAKSFINAVLRKILSFRETKWPHILNDPSVPPGVRFGFPDWLIDRWSAQFGGETPALLESLNERPRKMARIAQSGNRDTVLVRLHERGISAEASSCHPDFLYIDSWQELLRDPLFLNGEILAQDVSAIFPVLFIAGDKPESVADVCAAPGGKLSALRQYCPTGTSISGFDRSQRRLEICRNNLQRLGMTDISLTKADAEKDCFPEFSHILADVPCSGFGVIRKRPDLRWRRKPNDMYELLKTQSSILQNCAKYVRKGGLLVYSTCTFDHEENMGTVQRFLEKETQFRIETPVSPIIPKEMLTTEGAVASYPHRHLCEGSFAIALRKY